MAALMSASRYHPVSMIDGFVPRPATGFQVKQQDMPRAEILDEMHPNGVIRPSIQALADQSGAYIIVSSQGSTADTALANRRDAMKEAMQGVPNADQLLLDFYDRTRIATWVRSHEAIDSLGARASRPRDCRVALIWLVGVPARPDHCRVPV